MSIEATAGNKSRHEYAELSFNRIAGRAVEHGLAQQNVMTHLLFGESRPDTALRCDVYGTGVYVMSWGTNSRRIAGYVPGLHAEWTPVEFGPEKFGALFQTTRSATAVPWRIVRRPHSSTRPHRPL